MANASIKNRIATLEKKTKYINKPSVVIIDRDNIKNCWEIKEQYYNGKIAETSYKRYFYDDYNEYLEKANLPNDIPIILFDF